MSSVAIRFQARALKPHKAIKSARFDVRTVLTASPWEFVSLWLKREKQENALLLWNQAREFHQVALGLSLQSAPLAIYYSCMNATKALLTAKGLSFNPHHGVRADDLRGSSIRIRLSNEGVKIKSTGVLPSLSTYFGETETATKQSLKEILFNIPYVHRTYCLTYIKQRDMFLPLTDCGFVVNPGTKDGFFQANISIDFQMSAVKRYLPNSMIPNPSEGARAIRSASTFALTRPENLNNIDLMTLRAFNETLRKDLHYINGTQTLWYLKLRVKGPARLERYTPTLTLAAMHRLSEICRYRPVELAKFMASDESWLLTELVQSAPNQFLDAIAAELTGYQFLLPNVRPAA